MIVVRRSDVEPGGRYPGGRLAPVIPMAVAAQEPSPREVREQTYQSIQDEGYLRGQRARNPQRNTARATAEVVGKVVRSFPRSASSLDQTSPFDLRSDSWSPLQGDRNEPQETAIAPEALSNFFEREAEVEQNEEFDLAQNSGGSGGRFDLFRRFLNRLDRSERGRERSDRSAREIQQRDLQTEIVYDVARKFAQTKKPKIEIELRDIVTADSPASAIREFTRLWRRGDLKNPAKPDSVVQLNLRQVTNEEAAEIAKRTGLDVTGFQYAIDTQGLSHAFRRHGIGNEAQSDQIPISEDSVSMLLDIVSDPANIVEVRDRSPQAPKITYRKRVNGHFLFVEQVRRKDGKLSLLTHYIRKN